MKSLIAKKCNGCGQMIDVGRALCTQCQLKKGRLPSATRGGLTVLESAALNQLREHVEDYPDKQGWAQVYLDNCPMSQNRKSWSGVLASLTNKGLYRPQGDGVFGDVKVAGVE